MDSDYAAKSLTINKQSSSKFPLKIFYHDIYTNGIHPDARFPRDRYVKLLQQLTAHSQTGMFDFVVPKQASKSDLLTTHDQNMSMIFLPKILLKKRLGESA